MQWLVSMLDSELLSLSHKLIIASSITNNSTFALEKPI